MQLPILLFHTHVSIIKTERGKRKPPTCRGVKNTAGANLTGRHEKGADTVNDNTSISGFYIWEVIT